jgi:cell wall-associated NlpC family hydrolase
MPAAEAGPDLSTFGGAGAAGGIVGTKNLQSAVDSLTQTVLDFEKAVTQISAFADTLGKGAGGAAAAGSFVNGSAFPTPAAGTTTAGRFPVMYNPFTGYAQGPTSQTAWSAFPGLSTAGGTLGAAATPTGAQAPAAAQPAQQRPVMMNTMAAAAASGITAMAGYGSANMTGQLALNTYQFGAQLGMNGGNFAYNQQLLARQAYGSAGGGTGLFATQANNAWGQSPQDLAQAFSILGQQAGNPMLNQTSFGQNLLGGTAQFSYLNPAMSGTQAAQAISQLYTPSQSLAMTQLGYTQTPLQRGVPGGSRNMAQVVSGMMSADMFGSKYGMSNSQVQAQLGPNGIMYQNLLAAGMNPSTYASSFETYNRLFAGNGKNAPALSTGAAQNLMNQFGSQDPSKVAAAQATLKKYGVGTTDLDKLKAMQGTAAAKQGDQSAGFTAGVQAFARAVSDFNTATERMLNATGMNENVGKAKGFLGGLDTFGGIGLGGLGAFGAGRLAWKAGSRLFGKSAGADTAAGETAAGGDVAAGGAATAGSIAASLLLPLTATLASAWGLSKIKTKGAGDLLNPTSSDLGIHGNWAQDLFGGKRSKGWLTGDIAGIFGGAATPTGAVSPKGSKTTSSISSVSKQGKEAVGAAETQLGVPYVWGGESPGVGFDCSGLTQWAYKRAGVNIPRTADAQWEFLRKKAVSTDKVEEGDMVFMAGSDGTAGAPGHVGMMVSNSKLIQAPYTGADVQIIPYDPGAWSHAARPSGSLAGGGLASGTGGALSGGQNPAGNGPGMSVLGGGGTGDSTSEGSTSELSAYQSAIVGGGGGGSGYYGLRSITATTASNDGGSPGKSLNIKVPQGGGTPAANMALGKKEAAQYGWGSGTQWSDLVKLWNQESGWNNNAQNPTSTAYGIAQFLNSTWGPYGAKTSNAGLQIKYGLEYIKSRYGSPEGAWAHEVADNWYAKGGTAPAGSVGVVGERGPELVRFGKAADVLNAGDSARLMQSAMGPHRAGVNAGGLNYSTASPAYSGQTGTTRGTNGQVTLNFWASSVVIHRPQSSGNSLVSGASARTMAKLFVEQVSKMDLYSAIASGANS